MSNAVVISGVLVGTRELIVELGGDPMAIADEAGLPARVFEDHDMFVRAAQVVDFLELAARSCGRSDFGLLHARRLPRAIIGEGWMMMRAAATIGEALRDYVALYGLYTDAGSMRIEQERDGIWMDYSFLDIGRWGVRQVIHLTLGFVCLFVAESLARNWHPPRTLLRQSPDDAPAFGEFFGPSVRFGQDRDAIFIDHPTLCAPMGAGAVRRRLHRTLALQTAGRGPAVVPQARAVLRTLLRYEHCSIESLGVALGVSPRTLQRRFNDAGTSYREVIDEIRADLALRHVQRSDLSFALVASLLGYDSQAAFSRAFRRWYGVTPQTARRSPL